MMHKAMVLQQKEQLRDVGILNKKVTIKIVQKNSRKRLEVGGMNIKIYMILLKMNFG